MESQVKKKLITTLKNSRVSLQELADKLQCAPETAQHHIDHLQASGVNVHVGTGHRTRKKLYHIDVLPTVGNAYHVSGASREKKEWHFAVTSDWHINSIFHLPKSLEECLQRTEDAGITDVYHAGDWLDGMGIYKGHLENVTTPSVEHQTDAVAKVLRKHPNLKFRGIAGNHDYSFTQQNGIKPLALLEAKADNFQNLGDMRADVVVDGIRVRLLHGAGGRNYARSYPSQTYLRDYFSGLERADLANIPHILVVGHFHTFYEGFDHTMHVMQPGSFQDGDNEYCIRRGLTGPTGLFHVKASVQNGVISDWQTTYIKPGAARKEKGHAFAKTSRSYVR